MLNGAATAARMFRPRTTGRELAYILPASVGVFFPTCWNGQETRHHAPQSGESCPNCLTSVSPGRLSSLHAIVPVNAGSNACVMCMDHFLTCTLANQLLDDTYLVRPLRVIVGPGKSVRVERIGCNNFPTEDLSRAAHRIVQVWQRYFRGAISGPVGDLLKSGENWLDK